MWRGSLGGGATGVINETHIFVRGRRMVSRESDLCVICPFDHPLAVGGIGPAFNNQGIIMTFPSFAPLRWRATAVAVATLMATTASAATVEITVANAQGAGGLYLTPLLGIFHNGSYATFSTDPASRASAGVKLVAEEGMVGVAAADAQAAGATTAVIANPAGFGGAPVLDPGEVTTLRIDLDTSSPVFFSFLSMIIPSNDTFIGSLSPTAYQLFDDMGKFVFRDAISVLIGDAWDGGTEADDGNGAAFAPPTGTASTVTDTAISRLSNLDFLIGRPTAAGGLVQSASGTLATISFREVVAPVPLPAGLPLLMAGLGALGFLRRHARAQA